MRRTLSRISLISSAVILLMVIALATSCSQKREAKIVVRDTEHTPGVKVVISNVTEDIRLLSGSTDSEGQFEYLLSLKSGQNLKITFEKTDYDISPNEQIFAFNDIKDGVLEIVITANPQGKMVNISVRNQMTGIEIRAINPSGDTIFLGKTNRQGLLIARLEESSFPSVQFDYAIPGGQVIADNPNYDVLLMYHEIPKRIELSVIPTSTLEFKFSVMDRAGADAVPSATISSSSHDVTVTTDNRGRATARITPGENGPFIGDRINWQPKKAKHEVIKSVSSQIVLGQNSYPTDDGSKYYDLRLARKYTISIQVLEDSSPLANTVLLLNGKPSDPSDSDGMIIYEYYKASIGRNISLTVEKNSGLSVEKSTSSIRLEEEDKSIKVQLQSIHAILKIVDDKTGKPVSGVVVREKGEKIGQSLSGNRLKIVKKQLATYNLEISDELDTYHPKTFKLAITQSNVGQELVIKLVPKISYEFKIVDSESGKAVANVELKRFGKSLGKSNSKGQISDKLEDEKRDQLTYTVSAPSYKAISLDLASPSGRVEKTIKIERLYATVFLQNSQGEPLQGVMVGLEKGKGVKTDSFGEAKIYPSSTGKEYVLYITDPNSVVESVQQKVLFGEQAQRYALTLKKQPWVELQINLQAAGYKQPLANAQITAGNTKGNSDEEGKYRLKVENRSASIKFKISKKGYITTTVDVTPIDQLTLKEVSLKRLQARLIVLDSRTQQPVGNLVVSVNGERVSQTNPQSGSAEIFPETSPSTLEIMISSRAGDYQTLTRKVAYKYEKPELGIFEVTPKPTTIDVSLRWAGTGMPVSGTLEIDMPFDLYELTPKDQGKHSFNYYDRYLNPNLKIIAQTPGSGMSFERTFPIQFTPGIYKVEIIDILRPIPRLRIEVDPSTTVSIQRESTGEIEVSLNEGTFEGDLSDFGAYNIILSGANYVSPDTIPEYIEKAMTILKLEPPKDCLEIADAYYLDSLDTYRDLAWDLPANIDCYCDENQRAARISLIAKDYERAVNFIDRVAAATISTTCGMQWKSPYLRIWALQAYLEINKDENLDKARLAFDEFNQRVQLLPDSEREQAVCQANYFYGMILYKTVQLYQEEVTKTRGSDRNSALGNRNEVGESARDFLELYQLNTSDCGKSLQYALDDVKKILSTFRI